MACPLNFCCLQSSVLFRLFLYPLIVLYQYIGTNCHFSDCKKAIKYLFFSIFDTRNGFPISELVGNHIYSFFLSRLGSAVIIDCTQWIIFLGHWHKWVVQRMADLLPNTQPPAPALGMLVNNSETETPSTLTRLSTTDGKCYDSSNRGGGEKVFHRKSWITSHIHQCNEFACS